MYNHHFKNAQHLVEVAAAPKPKEEEKAVDFRVWNLDFEGSRAERGSEETEEEFQTIREECEEGSSNTETGSSLAS